MLCSRAKAHHANIRYTWPGFRLHEFITEYMPAQPDYFTTGQEHPLKRCS